jgi:hypothetical protein
MALMVHMSTRMKTYFPIGGWDLNVSGEMFSRMGKGPHQFIREISFVKKIGFKHQKWGFHH